ncbi:hypothetical protein ACQP2F_14180 [Actinoplanes sp. CA-030573]|uniref:hypothetical protein n=1 Tax=Actinoplanes sp. CA-030573 TaxID=3239898 RepID=UPI003D93FA25
MTGVSAGEFLLEEWVMVSTAVGLPICRHVRLGSELIEIDNRLRKIGDELAAAYPADAVATNPVQARVTLQRLRIVLDDISSREHAHADGWSTTIYHSFNPVRRFQKLAPILDRHRSTNPPCCGWS